MAASVKVLRPARADLNRRKSLRTPDGIVRPHHRYRAEKASSLSASSTPPRTSNNGRRIVFFTWTGFDGLCARYRRLRCTGKPINVVTVAIARELAAFAWAIAITIMPAFQQTA